MYTVKPCFYVYEETDKKKLDEKKKKIRKFGFLRLQILNAN